MKIGPELRAANRTLATKKKTGAERPNGSRRKIPQSYSTAISAATPSARCLSDASVAGAFAHARPDQTRMGRDLAALHAGKTPQTGALLIALGVPNGWLTVISPIVMTTLLMRVSGVALLEKTLVIAAMSGSLLRWVCACPDSRLPSLISYKL